MTFSSKDATVGTKFTIEVDFIKYEISTTDMMNYDSFARVIVKDCLTGEHHYCDGIFEAHGRRFLFMWGKEYNPNINNWIHNHDLTVEVI